MKGRNGTPRQWQRKDEWKYGNRPPLDVDPLHVEPPDFGQQVVVDEDDTPLLGWAMVALVVVGVVLLIVREVLT